MDTGQPLAGQVAVVTGAGRGIGAAIARKLAKLGASVVLCGRTQSTLDSTAKAVLADGGRAEVIPCDVTVLHQLEHAAARVDSTFGRLDILVNNAGIGGFNHPLHNLPPAEWDRILNTNLRGVYFAIHAFVALMIRARSGHIINVSSLAGKNALPNGAAYAAAANRTGPSAIESRFARDLPRSTPRDRRTVRRHVA